MAPLVGDAHPSATGYRPPAKTLVPCGDPVPDDVLSILRDAYGEDIGRVGSVTRGHEADGCVCRNGGECSGACLVYGELLPTGCSRALRRLGLAVGGEEAGSGRTMLELGMGTGKVALQALIQCPGISRVIGVELSRPRFALAVEGLRRLVKARPADFSLEVEEAYEREVALPRRKPQSQPLALVDVPLPRRRCGGCGEQAEESLDGVGDRGVWYCNACWAVWHARDGRQRAADRARVAHQHAVERARAATREAEQSEVFKAGAEAGARGRPFAGLVARRCRLLAHGVAGTPRVLELRRGDFLRQDGVSDEEYRQADVIMLQVRLPQDVLGAVQRRISVAHDGCRLFILSDLRTRWSLQEASHWRPWRQGDGPNPEDEEQCEDKYATTWAATYGVTFHTFRADSQCSTFYRMAGALPLKKDSYSEGTCPRAVGA